MGTPTVERLKQHLNIEHSADDAQLSFLLSAAEEAVRQYIGASEDWTPSALEELSVYTIATDMYYNRGEGDITAQAGMEAAYRYLKTQRAPIIFGREDTP